MYRKPHKIYTILNLTCVIPGVLNTTHIYCKNSSTKKKHLLLLTGTLCSQVINTPEFALIDTLLNDE